MTQTHVEIAGRRIGQGHPPYVVAEMSANHGGDFDRAAKIIEAAAAAGADAVKLQTYTADGMTVDGDDPRLRIEGTPWAGRTLHDLYTEAAMPWEWQPRLKRIAEQLGLVFFSSVFDAEGLEFLEGMHVPAYKIASFELVDLPLLRLVAQTRKPIILSTGMATLAEIDEAVSTIRAAGSRQLILLHCTSAYPAEPEQMDLRTIGHLAETFGVPVGLSDHTLDPTVPPVAVARGASLVEKHLTLSRDTGGADSSFSLEPDEFAAMVRAVHTAHAALGAIRYGPSEQEAAGRRLRRSLFAVKDIVAGELLTTENVRAVRPADGLHPRYLVEVLGRPARVAISRGTPLDWSHVD